MHKMAGGRFGAKKRSPSADWARLMSNERSNWKKQIILCLATAVGISTTAYLCAWFEYCDMGGKLTLWQFTWNSAVAVNIQLICVLTGVIAFPIFCLRRKRKPASLPLLRNVLIISAFSIIIAVAISSLHIGIVLNSGH
jgi:hypothetical protein